MSKLAGSHAPGNDFQKLMQFMESQPLFQAMVKQHNDFEAKTRAQQASPEYKKFSSEYDRKFPQIEELLDDTPISDEAKKQHDFIMSKLWPSGDKSKQNNIIGYVNRGDYRGASSLLNVNWEAAKKLNAEQAASVHGPTALETLQKAGADTVNQVKQKGEQVIAYISDLKAVERDLQKAAKIGEEIKEFLCLEELMAIKDTVRDCQKGFTLITSAETAGAAGAASGVGPALAALMITSVVAGIGLEIAASILGIMRCLEKSFTGHEPYPKNVATQVQAFRAVAENIQKVTEPIVSHLQEIEKYGKYIRKLLHHH